MHVGLKIGLSFAVGGLLSCGGRFPETEPPPPNLRRLSSIQYANIIHDVFGSEVVVPDRLEPDSSFDGFVSIGSALTTISPRGVELYESASFQIVKQVFDDDLLRDRLLTCSPGTFLPDPPLDEAEDTDVAVDSALDSDSDAEVEEEGGGEVFVDEACVQTLVEVYGRRLWRRPLTEEETQRLVAIAAQSGEVLGGADQGLQYALAALLQSPNFLFRVELGEADPELPGSFRFSNYEMASKLSFFFWNTGPDAVLLDAAEEGLLTTEEGLSEQVERLMSSHRAREGFRNFVTEYLELHELDALKKDSLFYTHMDVTVGPSAREETLLGFDALVFDEDGDYRDILTTNRTFVNRKLASMYDVQSPVREGFGELLWPDDSPRSGLLGQVSILSLNAHPVSSSATLRGLFVREKFLCQELPPPPSDVDTSLPEPSEDAPTLRDRVAEHLSNPSCSVCHQITDPIGLALENFDGIGRYRLRENNVVIDPSGDLDGVEFEDAKGLATVLSESDLFTACFVQQLGRYANGRLETTGEEAGYEYLTERFAKKKYRVQALMREMVMSPTFRTIGEVE